MRLFVYNQDVRVYRVEYNLCLCTGEMRSSQMSITNVLMLRCCILQSAHLAVEAAEAEAGGAAALVAGAVAGVGVGAEVRVGAEAGAGLKRPPCTHGQAGGVRKGALPSEGVGIELLVGECCSVPFLSFQKQLTA